MILLDTNVVSEVMKAAPSDAVVAWLNEQNSDTLRISAITIGEIAFGLNILPEGDRRSALTAKFEQFVSLAFDQRTLAYDESAAHEYGEIMATRREIGRPMSVPDGQIAAIARSRHLAVATRNVRDFERCRLEVIDPFAMPR